ncbi:MAG: hypothetical protein ACP5U0_08110 [Caldisphaera sp.]
MIQTEKILLSFYSLMLRTEKKKIVLEDVAVAAWKDNPTEFCMRGYKEHPDVERIRRVLSKLVSEGYISGNVNGYKITEKGEIIANSLQNKESTKEVIPAIENAEASRKLRSEMLRLINSKIFREFLNAKATSKKIDLLESDFFEFLGTSPRSIGSSREKRLMFIPKYKFMTEEVLPFCKAHAEKDHNAALILELYKLLYDKFGNLIEGK